eukprot:jgi/Botrbrau1/4260/Bobra.0044s0053.1
MATSQDIVYAVECLLHTTDETVRKAYEEQLERWQSTREAWSMSDHLLHDSQCREDVHYFAAQTLRRKLQFDFEELPESAVVSLRDSLISLLLNFASGPRTVRTQLCLAVAALAAHMPAHNWGNGGVISWLTQRLAPVGPALALPCMLELLTVLPQEAGTYMPAVRPERRRQLTGELIAAAPLAIEILSSCLQQQGAQAPDAVLRSFEEWLKFKPGVGLDGATLAQHPLVAAALQGLQNTATFDAAVDVICELIYSTVDSRGPRPGMDPLIQRLVPAVLAQHSRFAVILQRARALHLRQDGAEAEAASLDDDEETAKGLARLFAELGEAYTSIIATGSAEAMEPVRVLLDVASYPDDGICAISFNFWHRLAHSLTSGFSQPEPLNEAEEQPTQVPSYERGQRLAHFQSPFAQLVKLIRGRVAYPPDFDSWHMDEKKDFRRSRYAVADVLVDAVGVLGPESTLQLLLEPLHEMAKEGGAPFDWQKAEASLYCIRSIHSQTVEPGHYLLTSLFQSLTSLPAVGQLRYTVCLTVGAYTLWLTDTVKTTGDTSLLRDILGLLTEGLGDKQSCRGAAMAMRNVLKDCSEVLGPFVPDLLSGVYAHLHNAGAVAKAMPGPAGTILAEDDVEKLIEGFTVAVSELPAEQRTQALNTLLMPVIQPLVTIVDATPEGQAPPSEQVLPYIDRLTVIVKNLPQPEVVVEALGLMWTLLETLLQRSGGDMRLMEHLCRVPRYALRNARKSAASLVPLLLPWLPRWFSATHHCSFLFVASEVIKVFGDDPAYASALGELFQGLVLEACNQLKVAAQFDQIPDLVDDVFLLAGRALSYAPYTVCNPQVLPTLINRAELGLLAQHREASRSVLDFITKVFNTAAMTTTSISPAGRDTFQTVIQGQGQLIVCLLLAGVGGALPQPRVIDIAETLHMILKTTGHQGYQWLAQAAGSLPPHVASQQELQPLLVVAAEIASKGLDANKSRDLENTLDDLSELCRRSKECIGHTIQALIPS